MLNPMVETRGLLKSQGHAPVVHVHAHTAEAETSLLLKGQGSSVGLFFLFNSTPLEVC